MRSHHGRLPGLLQCSRGPARLFACVTVALVVLAVPHVTVDPLFQSPWIAEGGELYANLGIAVAAAGDVNGDGFDDVIVGVHQYDQQLGRQQELRRRELGLSEITDSTSVTEVPSGCRRLRRDPDRRAGRPGTSPPASSGLGDGLFESPGRQSNLNALRTPRALSSASVPLSIAPLGAEA